MLTESRNQTADATLEEEFHTTEQKVETPETQLDAFDPLGVMPMVSAEGYTDAEESTGARRGSSEGLDIVFDHDPERVAQDTIAALVFELDEPVSMAARIPGSVDWPNLQPMASMVVAQGEKVDSLPEGAGTASALLALPTDHLFSQQWHLQNNTPGLLDLNLTEVWDGPGQTYTGAGVYVAIMDDGLQRTHHDLDANYSVARDWDFRDSDTNPSPGAGDNHGTAVAGIIGANRDGNGAVGIAYDSTIFGYRVGDLINDFLVTTMTDAADYASGAGGGGGYQADVMNMSYGTMYSGNWYDNALDTVGMNGLNAAFNNGVANGRGGLGTIYVKSAGNSRSIDHDANASSWNANRSTISVAAVNQDGFVSSYSTHGANILVSGFGTPGQVVTTDRTGGDGYNSGGANPDYTFGFNGTSAAAPMVSGVIALMLEANPNLGWRDVQDILAYSARHVGTDVGGGTGGSEEYAWQFNNAETWNGGGLHFSRDYGFGLVDAHAAVRMAETWGDNPPATNTPFAGAAGTSGNNVRVFSDLINAAETVDGVAYGGDTTGTSGTESYSFTTATNIEIEHVTVEMSFSHTYMDDVEISIISPDGTTHQLINDIGGSEDFSGRWTFTTNAFWGESTVGTWQIVLTDDAGADEWRITDLDVSLWGDTNTVDDLFVFTEEFSDYAGGAFGHVTSFNGGGGVDTLNATAVVSGSTINLLGNTGVIDGINVSLVNINRVFTGDGNDVIFGDGVSQVLHAGRGQDIIRGGTASEQIFGGAGNDTLNDGNGTDTVDGGDGDDTLVAGDSSLANGDSWEGGAGIDTLTFQLQNLTNATFDMTTGMVTVGGNSETFTGIENVTGSRGNDIITGNGGANVLNGWSGADEINGGGGNDTIFGGGGNDVLRGGFGTDTVNGNGGADQIIIDGGDGVDYADGGSGRDLLDYRGGFLPGDIVFNMGTGAFSYGATNRTAENFENFQDNDGNGAITGTGIRNVITGNGGDDTIHGLGGNDILLGGLGDDTLVGGGASDNLIGGAGSDDLRGGAGSDVLNGGGGNDMLNGGNSADTLIGGGGADTLLGDLGADALDGGNGEDVLDGGRGNDDLTGGLGADIFNFGANFGDDTVHDFQVGIDTFRIEGGYNPGDISFQTVGAHTLATLDPTGDTFLVLNTSVNDLNTFNDFQFV